MIYSKRNGKNASVSVVFHIFPYGIVGYEYFFRSSVYILQKCVYVFCGYPFVSQVQVFGQFGMKR